MCMVTCQVRTTIELRGFFNFRRKNYNGSCMTGYLSKLENFSLSMNKPPVMKSSPGVECLRSIQSNLFPLSSTSVHFLTALSIKFIMLLEVEKVKVLNNNLQILGLIQYVIENINGNPRFR